MVQVKDDVTVKEYFEEYVPKIFSEQLENTAVMGMEGTTAAIMFNVAGEGQKHTYSLVVRDAKDLKVVPGPAENPLLTLEMTEEVWRDAVTGKIGGAVEMFTDMGQMANRARFDKVSAIKGTLALDLSREGGDNTELSIIFNGADSPKATFQCSLDTWVKMSTGELSGVTAFMGGQLKIEGDMPFAVELSSIVA